MIVRFVLGLVFALVSFSAQAQGNWTAWVYTPSDGTVVRISAYGEIIDAYRLPLGPAFNAYGDTVLTSPNGRFIAYTTRDTLTGGGNQQLAVYDTHADVIRFTYDLTGVEPANLSFARFPHSMAFDEGAQTLAFGVLRGGEWELVVANLATETLSGGAPLTTADSGLQGGNLLPIPEIVRGNAVRFFLIPVDAGYVREYPAYLWTPGQAVAEVGASSAFSDVLAGSGEIAVPVHDDTLASAGDGATALAYNAVDLVQNGRVRLLEDSSADISQVWWISGGGQVLIQGFDATINANVLKLYGRDGALAGQFSGGLRDIYGTPDGFVGLFPSDSGVGLAYVATAGGTFEPVTLWTTSDGSARLIHVQK